ncbi:MAG TPA: metal-dependent hydrolase [Gemmatimonadales bacterium]|nr:metal-dependent hydrolase [Gemmatimonadales bacterium]
MDNLAHTLVGAALGRAVAGRELPAAGWIGAVAGNAPDWAELVLRPSSWTPRAGVDYLVYHRGITHAFLGAAVEIVALTGLVGLILRWWARRHGGNPPAWRSIAACVALTVASHLYLDWQGSYGLRPLLPWSGRWYYADWVAIVDPVFWLVPLVALAWGARRHWAPALVYLLSLIGITTLVLWRGRELVAWGVRLATLGGAVAGVAGWTEHWFGVAGRRRAAAYGLLALAGYVAANAAASTAAKAEAHAAASRRFGPDAAWAALTVIGHPFHWEKLAASRDSVAGSGWVAPRHLDDAAVRTALATPRGRAIAQFARFLVAAVDSSGGRLRVLLWDARFHPTAPGPGAWAAVAIPVR